MQETGLVSGEHVAVTVAEETYEASISKAMSRFKDFVPLARVYRAESELEASPVYDDEAVERWYIVSATGNVSAGGAQISVTVVFKRETS